MPFLNDNCEQLSISVHVLLLLFTTISNAKQSLGSPNSRTSLSSASSSARPLMSPKTTKIAVKQRQTGRTYNKSPFCYSNIRPNVAKFNITMSMLRLNRSIQMLQKEAKYLQRWYLVSCNYVSMLCECRWIHLPVVISFRELSIVS